jgi:hypothetical protein
MLLDLRLKIEREEPEFMTRPPPPRSAERAREATPLLVFLAKSAEWIERKRLDFLEVAKSDNRVGKNVKGKGRGQKALKCSKV